ncbi:hypothetical protein [Humidesulfovibrio mexicanus]|uniref:hypothetical protein n=1 Tax=Humidesulfovibrio mexicanus TaxID=147047 RepID=UPI0015C59571|nr:hypothetical protein [Humidesulfovibrio mexicanus]
MHAFTQLAENTGHNRARDQSKGGGDNGSIRQQDALHICHLPSPTLKCGIAGQHELERSDHEQNARDSAKFDLE